MRELKFRYIYQHEEDTIFPERSLEIADVNDSIWTLDQIAEWEPDNYIDVCLSSSWKVIDINQYTGLKDRNWKEIYEGDIVEYLDASWFSQDDVWINRWIVELDLREWINFTNRDSVEMEDIDFESEVEVIWNIYENPELSPE